MSEPGVTSRLMVFLFTDLVDSTGIKERLGDRDYVQFVLQPHNAIFRESLGQFPSGLERDNAGDGFFVTFGGLEEAVRFALLVQHRLESYAWERVRPATRIGIHLGDATEFEDSGSGQMKAAGQAVDLAARVMALASGNQILLTRAAFDNARQYVHSHPVAPTKANGDDAALELQWLAHGRYLFKGKDEPMEVFEVGAAGHAPLRAPTDSDKARRVVSHEEEATLGWRPGAGRTIPRRPGWALVRQLGAGGFGEVWLAHHERTKEERVFKFCFDAERLRSFKRELTLFRLIRDNLGNRDDIARLLEVQVEQPPYYLESEFAAAGNLTQWAQQRGGLATVPVAQRLDLLARIARAAAAAHSLGIIHKDIKPSNVLIVETVEGVRPRLTDFGIGVLTNGALLAKLGITESGFTQSLANASDSSHTGTRLYAPPESQVGKPATTAGDVYALGVMLYQFVAGDLQRPLGLGWEEDVADDLLREDILVCTHRDPARRLPCAGDLADRLEQLAARRDERRAALRLNEERLAVEKRAGEQALRIQALRGILIAASVAIVLMSGLLYFSHRGYMQAVQSAEEGNGQWALESNQFAAELAAEKVTEELGRYFERARDEAEKPALLPLFLAVAQHSPALAQLVDPLTPAGERQRAREALVGEDARQMLERYLRQRLKTYEAAGKTDSRAPRFASIFVTDDRGTQLASALLDDSASPSIGRNWAHRAYFHGGAEELAAFASVPSNPRHIERTHLTATYFSTAQHEWTIAISTPICDEQQQFAGILALTVDLRNFHFASEMSHGQKQSVVLADVREGKEKGTILHHPLFDKLAAQGKMVPGDLLGFKYHVPAALMAGEPTLAYRDPVGQFPDPDGLAKEYDRRWLAAASPVIPPIGAARNSDSGLVVLVQSDYDLVVEPTRQLGQQFMRNSFWMLIVILTGGLSMMYIVSGTFRELGARLKGSDASLESPRISVLDAADA
jgi:serine/threonine protein kinase/class 3 adenylate cyclase